MPQGTGKVPYIIKLKIMTDILQINSIRRAIGQLGIQVGVSQIREAQSEFSTTLAGIEKIQGAVKNFGISVSQADTSYYFTSWDNWRKIIDVLNPIAKNFVWEAERFDCDNRASLMSSLISLLFRINTCGKVYCDVYDAGNGKYKYTHYCNMIVDDAGNCYLWDVDYSGLTQKVTSNLAVMGINKYQFYNLRVE